MVTCRSVKYLVGTAESVTETRHDTLGWVIYPSRRHQYLNRGHTGVVDKEPVKDTFRFWYMVRIESEGLTTVRRFAEEELEKPDN
jgi:hypothetical protein